MKIAFVSLMGGAVWGGSEALWHSMAVHALQQGDKVFISIYNWGRPHDKIITLQQNGATIRFRKKYNAEAGPMEKVVRFIRNRRPSLNKDYQSIIDFKPDNVFISQGDSFDLAIHHKPLYNLLRQNNISYSFICHSHAQYSFIPPKEIYPGAVEIFNNAKHVFFVSKRQWQLTERRLVCRLSNGQLTWNPINMHLTDYPLSWPEGTIIQLALIGALIGSKGQDTALEVLSGVQWKKRRWRLNIYGNGEGETYLKDMAVFYGIQENVAFHGHVNDIIQVWIQNHILLIPSAGEGLPISLAEAMACGRPAIATDVGGNTELVAEDQTGFIAASPATHHFKSAMEKAWLHTTNWKQLGINAFNKIHQLYEKDPHIKIYDLLKREADHL